jgi:peptidoglycan hydrolase CwlO-like protein
MFDSKDVLSAGGVVIGAAAIAALGFAAGYMAGRDPQRLRRWVQAAAGGLERMQTALSETREELADLWAEARADARAAIEEDAIGAAHEAAAKASAAAVVKAAAAAARKRAPRRAPRAATRPPATGAGGKARRAARSATTLESAKGQL